MNFYDKRIGTPFMFFAEIYRVLASFDKKSKPGEGGNGSDPSGAPFWKMDGDDKIKLNRWPVPMPRWCNPDYADEDKSDEDELVSNPKSGRRQLYGYFNGKKVMLF